MNEITILIAKKKMKEAKDNILSSFEFDEHGFDTSMHVMTPITWYLYVFYMERGSRHKYVFCVSFWSSVLLPAKTKKNEAHHTITANIDDDIDFLFFFSL